VGSVCELEGHTMNEETTTPRKRYDEAFKRSAVQHWQDSGKSASQVSNTAVQNNLILDKRRLFFGPFSLV